MLIQQKPANLRPPKPRRLRFIIEPSESLIFTPLNGDSMEDFKAQPYRSTGLSFNNVYSLRLYFVFILTLCCLLCILNV